MASHTAALPSAGAGKKSASGHLSPSSSRVFFSRSKSRLMAGPQNSSSSSISLSWRRSIVLSMNSCGFTCSTTLWLCQW